MHADKNRNSLELTQPLTTDSKVIHSECISLHQLRVTPVFI
ncbi:hypothetical protein At1D1460_53570 (plasmid) [Agrobacterium tumefaciens]|nr:hypothetical protein At1D1460_53570 [Agrobacterium tumefaciens]AYM14955.1 hypothetical protein At1D1108_53280 [Agrobacterium tumefaciens]AYM61130.1 hypothetical protein At1D132_51220 [Agrobacterium fabrum]